MRLERSNDLVAQNEALIWLLQQHNKKAETHLARESAILVQVTLRLWAVVTSTFCLPWFTKPKAKEFFTIKHEVTLNWERKQWANWRVEHYFQKEAKYDSVWKLETGLVWQVVVSGCASSACKLCIKGMKSVTGSCHYLLTFLLVWLYDKQNRWVSANSKSGTAQHGLKINVQPGYLKN